MLANPPFAEKKAPHEEELVCKGQSEDLRVRISTADQDRLFLSPFVAIWVELKVHRMAWISCVDVLRVSLSNIAALPHKEITSSL